MQKQSQEFAESDLKSDAMYALGVTSQELGDFEGARKTFDQFATDFPEHGLISEVQMRKAETLLGTRDYAEAEKLFAKVAAVKDFPAVDHATFRQAFSIAQQNRYDEAGDLFASILKQFPTNAETSSHKFRTSPKQLQNSSSALQNSCKTY